MLQPVLYAGEMEFNDQQQLLRWNNMSGTYQCDPNHSYQTGLPFERFWRLGLQPTVVDEATSICISETEWLVKVLIHTEAQFDTANVHWEALLESCLSDDARVAYGRLQSMVTERCLAVNMGYRSVT